MSKKSRRRNRRVLSALALLGTGLALANRGKANQMSGKQTVSDAQKSTQLGSSPNENEFKVQDVVVNVPKRKPPEVISRNTGITIGSSGNKVPADPNNKRPYLNRMADKRRLDAMRAFRTNEAYRGITPVEIFQDSMLGDTRIGGGVSAKKGGRIVKGKKKAVRTGAAKRGFGRAFKGGKK